MNYKQIRRIISNITYKPEWWFSVEERKDCYLLQAQFLAKDMDTNKIEVQHGRKWFISRFACKAEIVRTAYKAIVTAEEHEVQENFKYKKQAIHSPHFDPEALVRIYKRERRPFNKRMRDR